MKKKLQPNDDWLGYTMIDLAGYAYDNEEEFANASEDVLPISSVFWFLMSGKRTPQNDYERDLLREGKEMEAQGKIIEIPFD